MNNHSIVTKTQKGAAEIENRQYGLERAHRYVLILVDGKSTIDQLIEEKGAHLSDVKNSLNHLLAQGFITADGRVAETEGADCYVPYNQDISAIKAALIAVAREVLGGDADKIVARLEAAPNSRDGLQETVNGCKKLVRLVIDEDKAETLLTRCQGVLQGLSV